MLTTHYSTVASQAWLVSCLARIVNTQSSITSKRHVSAAKAIFKGQPSALGVLGALLSDGIGARGFGELIFL